MGVLTPDVLRSTGKLFADWPVDHLQSFCDKYACARACAHDPPCMCALRLLLGHSALSCACLSYNRVYGGGGCEFVCFFGTACRSVSDSCRPLPSWTSLGPSQGSARCQRVNLLFLYSSSQTESKSMGIGVN